MAYLQFGGGSEQATLQSQVSFGSTDTYVIELTFKIDADTGNDIHAWLGNNALTNYFYYRLSNQLLFWNFDGSTRTLSAPTTSILGIENTVDLICDAGTKTIEWDGNTSAPFATPKVFLFDRFGSRGNAWYADGGLRRVRVFSDLAKTTLTYDWSADDSSYAPGTPILSELIANNFATGQNMPTDGSAWVDTGGGATLINVASSMPAMLGTSAITIQAPTLSITTSGSLPTLTASAQLTESPPTFTLAANAQMPTITGTAILSIIESSGIVVSASMPQLTASAQLSIEQPNYQSTVNAILPTLNGSALIGIAAPGGVTLSVGSSMPTMTASGLINYIPPTLDISLLANMPPMTATAILLTGDREYYFAMGTEVTLPSESRAAILQTESRATTLPLESRAVTI